VDAQVQFGIQVVSALAYLHQRTPSIVHRDIKSSNILLDSSGKCKVSDFGMATYHRADLTAETGSYRWMAPEVMKHEPYDAKSDVYSFGVVLWELMTNDIPFREYTPLQAAFAVAEWGIQLGESSCLVVRDGGGRVV
jgi:serine/threonine protein kinase